jgi:dipeptidyl-peptidase-4
MYQYSGPGSQEVADRFPLRDYFWHQMLAQKGYIVACVDGRGTGYRGRDFKKVTYQQLGKIESDDQIAAARYLRTLPFVDSSRMGIWGWSYGGFMSSTCLFKAPEVFKMAIAVAPVTNWRYYDNIYTERYMRTPQENPRGYDDNSPVNMVKNMRGKFLLVHGTADDNVHFQNSVELVEALQKAGKQFDFAMYPDKAHGISGGQTRYQLYGKMTDFILQNL